MRNQLTYYYKAGLLSINIFTWAARKYCLPFLVLTAVLAPAGCGKQDQSYHPVSAGHSWLYRITLETMEGASSQKQAMSSLPARETEAGVDYVYRSVTGIETLYRDTERGRERKGYVVPDGKLARFIEDPALILPEQLEIGTQWDSVIQTQALKRKGTPGETFGFELLAAVPISNRIVSVDEVVDVPAGRFRGCLKIESQGSVAHAGNQYNVTTMITVTQTQWFARGIGLIKRSIVEKSTNEAFAQGTLTMELESFQVP